MGYIVKNRKSNLILSPFVLVNIGVSLLLRFWNTKRQRRKEEKRKEGEKELWDQL